jgi:hypothetical protein
MGIQKNTSHPAGCDDVDPNIRNRQKNNARRQEHNVIPILQEVQNIRARLQLRCFSEDFEPWIGQKG